MKLTHVLALGGLFLSGCVLSGFALSGCASRAARGSGSLEPARALVQPSDASTWRGANEVASNGGTYLVRWRSDVDPLVRGRPLALDVWIFSIDRREEPLQDVRFAIDGDMPEHLHGLNRKPTVERAPHGGFRVEGFYLHMPGRWEIYFDVTRGAVTERAQLELELD